LDRFGVKGEWVAGRLGIGDGEWRGVRESRIFWDVHEWVGRALIVGIA
jgi:hypothetical protein